MEEYTYIEILIEDKSGRILVEQIMHKYLMDNQNTMYKIHGFKGIGKIPLKVKRVSQIKSKRLLTDLPMYLRGMSLSLENMPGRKVIFVILDSDDEDCAQSLKKNSSSYYEIGMFKCECAGNIGVLLDIRKNKSPSFNYFIGKLDGFCRSST